MKHLTFIVALICATISANAATIAWGSNGTTARFLINGTEDTSSANRLATGSLVALIYLGDATSFTFDNTLESYSETKTGVSGGTVVATANLTAGGRVAATYDHTPYTEMNGNYAMLYFDATSWDTITDGTKYGMTTGVQTVNLASEIDNTQTAYLTSNTAMTGTIAVPEPSVALMGLLGIGMLLKRRRA
jgi:hypothetical protein